MDGFNKKMKGKMMDVHIEGAMTNGRMDKWMNERMGGREGLNCSYLLTKILPVLIGRQTY